MQLNNYYHYQSDTDLNSARNCSNASGYYEIPFPGFDLDVKLQFCYVQIIAYIVIAGGRDTKCTYNWLSGQPMYWHWAQCNEIL